MIEPKQIWTNRKNDEDVRITKVNHKNGYVGFMGENFTSPYYASEYVSSISTFERMYYYNKKKTNEEIIRDIIQ